MPPPPRAQAFLRYVLREYDEGRLTFARIPQLILVTALLACFAAGIWTWPLHIAGDPDGLIPQLDALYRHMLLSGGLLILLYATALAGLLLYRRRRLDLFPKAKPEQKPSLSQQQEGL